LLEAWTDLRQEAAFNRGFRQVDVGLAVEPEELDVLFTRWLPEIFGVLNVRFSVCSVEDPIRVD